MNSIRNIGLDQVHDIDKQKKSSASDSARQADFRDQINASLGKIDKLKFSGHAIDRLADRGVVLSGQEAERLVKAVDAAEGKGARESLVLLDELAFVVSVKNRTVITACGKSGLKEGVFTKIDSAVFG